MPILTYRDGRVVHEWPQTQSKYPSHAFPTVISDAIDEACRHHGVQAELPAQAALGTLSLASHHFVNVQCPNFDPAPCSLFLLTISNSSGGKSLVVRRFLRAVSAYERKQEENVAASISEHRADLKIWFDDERRLAKEYRDAVPGSDDALRIRAERLQHEKNRPVQPLVRELQCAEVTPQGLRDMLVANGALGILSADATPTLNGPTFSQPAMLSDYWSGEDRAVGLVSGTRRPVEPRVTISLMFQQDQFPEYLESRGADAFSTGLVARFMVASPETIDQPGQEACIEDVPEPKLELFNERIASILNQPVPAPRERVVLRMTEDAKRYWKAFKESINDKLICGDYSSNMKLFFRKLAQQASRIAALFHYFEDEEGDISPRAMVGAITLCEWYAFEYFRVFLPFAPSQQQRNGEAARKLLEWLQYATANPVRYSKLTPGQYAERELKNYSPIRGDPEMLSVAIDMLQQEGHIATVYGKKGGRIIFHPAYMAQQFQPSNFKSPQANAFRSAGFAGPSGVSPWNNGTYGSNAQTNQPWVSRSIFDQFQPRASFQPGRDQTFVDQNAVNAAQSTRDERSNESIENEVSTVESMGDEMRAVQRYLEESARRVLSD